MLIANQELSLIPNPSASRSVAAVSPRQLVRPSSGPAHTPGHSSVSNSVKTSSPYLSSDPYSFLTAAPNPLDLRHTFPRQISNSALGSVKPAQLGHRYWCTVCNNRCFKHSDGWKKHEKEHEVKYVCMLKELFEPTKEGRRCTLCGALNQADSHQLIHNIAQCIEAARRPIFKRRYDMVGHLKDIHAIFDKALGGEIADKWRCKSSKCAWSCGFCVHLSTSHQEHLKHIGTAHFETGQSVKDWEYSNIIRGLLLQSGINEAWLNLLESLESFRPSEIKWNREGNENLLHRLERGLRGNETPQNLAKAAYDSAEFDWSLSEMDIMSSTTTTGPALNQDAGKSLPPSFQNHTHRSGEELVKCQPWSPPPHQAAQVPRSSLNPEARYAYATTVLKTSPARLLPAFNQSPGWDALTSDSGDANGSQPTTPFDDRHSYPDDPLVYTPRTPWSGYNITPDPAHGEGTFHYYNKYTSNWPINHQSNIHNRKIASTLKRSRDSLSPPSQTFSHGDRPIEVPRKKRCLKKCGINKDMSRSPDVDYEQPRNVGKNTQSEMRADSVLKDDLYDYQ